MGNEAFMGDPSSAEQIELVPFRAEFGPAFERLNREWLERFELLEAGDCQADIQGGALATAEGSVNARTRRQG